MLKAWVPAFAGMTELKSFVGMTKFKKVRPYSQVSPYKSRQSGFEFSINSSFQARFHSFNCFSRAIAAGIESRYWNHTRVFTPYFLVNPGMLPSRCCCKDRWSLRCKGFHSSGWQEYKQRVVSHRAQRHSLLVLHISVIPTFTFVIPADVLLTFVIPTKVGTQTFRMCPG